MSDEELAKLMDQAALLLRCGDEARGTTQWYLATEKALRAVYLALKDVGIAPE